MELPKDIMTIIQSYVKFQRKRINSPLLKNI